MFGDKGCMLQSNYSKSGAGLSAKCGDVIDQQRSVLVFVFVVVFCKFYSVSQICFSIKNNAALVHLNFRKTISSRKHMTLYS